ncbi:GGDEF domain-containing protein [Marinobacter sp. X15-166B]|uniref:sensor domain-containing diguanylate cyclase n=1 Tax=Marinobacter sp. X15-166B TaxID=1897620 RepID=UPI00085BF376|nr:GGDEF domain-containing protein [Marinobacter sp. X15-166B]OEY65727.1 diguanylate cyclase [Marinobacter sp. X15-166B]
MGDDTTIEATGQYLEAIGQILDSLDALVYVADMDTHELLYINAYGRKYWGEPRGRKCWQVLQANQSGPCSFCNNHDLVDAEGMPTGVQVWEFQNTLTNRWLQCRDQAILWPDGRLVRLEVATDITERKAMEEQLRQAVQLAENRANTDDLTQLNNRRAFFALGEQTVKQAHRSGHSLAVILFDIDRFKRINDRYSHASGDKVLAGIARATRALIRDADIIARLGGEEFAVLLHNAGLDDARRLAERLRQAVENYRVTTGAHSLQCTASFGISTFHGRQLTLEQLVAEADHAMYRAKAAGRNRVASGPLIATDGG